MGGIKMLEMQAGLAPVNGTQLYYEVTGIGDPLVLIHGFSLDTRMWHAQVPALAAHYRVIAYDLRGFGRSPMSDGTPYQHADDLKGLLDYLSAGPAVLVGLSRGGQ